VRLDLGDIIVTYHTLPAGECEADALPSWTGERAELSICPAYACEWCVSFACNHTQSVPVGAAFTACNRCDPSTMRPALLQIAPLNDTFYSIVLLDGPGKGDTVAVECGQPCAGNARMSLSSSTCSGSGGMGAGAIAAVVAAVVVALAVSGFVVLRAMSARKMRSTSGEGEVNNLLT